MARSVGVSIENSFVNGLVTEATGLNFPENAVTESLNVVFEENGRVTRRLGFDFEADYLQVGVSAGPKAYVEYVWTCVAGDGNRTFFVQQIGGMLYAFRLDPSGLVSKNIILSFSLYAHSFVSAATLDATPTQFSSGNGKLFITNQYCQPLVMTYDPNTNSFVAVVIDVFTRDFVGVPDPDGVTNRPGSVGGEHRYNLQNQGWDPSFINYFYSGFGANPGLGIYPSNADVWWLYKDADEQFKPSLANMITRGNSPAPKGKYLLREFTRDRNSVSGVTGLPLEFSNPYRPSTSAFFAGRLFLSGVTGPTWTGKVYFSQIVTSPLDYGAMHQINDPTSEVAADLLPSDGGVISILEAGTIFKLWPLDASLLVFAANGIWQITGSNGIGFAANDYTVKKLSNIKTVSGLSFVDAGGFPLWWNEEGIFTCTLNSGLGSITVQSVSDKKIRKLIDDLPSLVKQYVKGAYNPQTKEIQWLFRDQNTLLGDYFAYNKILSLNTLSGAFSIWEIPAIQSHLKGIFTIVGTGSSDDTELVTTSIGQIVTTNIGENVTVGTDFVPAAVRSRFKYTASLLAVTSSITYAEEFNEQYVDWASGAVTSSYESYFISGYRIRGEGQRKFQANYVTVFSENEEPSAYFFQGIWDYANSPNTGRWGLRQKVDLPPTDYAYATRRLKVRGHGKVLQFKVTSVPNRPFDIIGWSAYESANAGP